jgi:hypothetical protein
MRAGSCGTHAGCKGACWCDRDINIGVSSSDSSADETDIKPAIHLCLCCEDRDQLIEHPHGRFQAPGRGGGHPLWALSNHSVTALLRC